LAVNVTDSLVVGAVSEADNVVLVAVELVEEELTVILTALEVLVA
jgi:hypothetical protein